MAELTPRQARFVEEYLLDLNGTQAAIRAGYAPGSADVEAARLLANARVAAAVAQAKAARSARVGLTADRVLEEIAALGFAKLTDFAEWEDERFVLKPSGEIDGRAVLMVKQTKKTLGATKDDEVILSSEQSIRLHDKVGALKLLGQHLGMFKEKHELSGPDGGPVPIQMVEDFVRRQLGSRDAR